MSGDSILKFSEPCTSRCVCQLITCYVLGLTSQSVYYHTRFMLDNNASAQWFTEVYDMQGSEREMFSD